MLVTLMRISVHGAEGTRQLNDEIVREQLHASSYRNSSVQQRSKHPCEPSSHNCKHGSRWQSS